MTKTLVLNFMCNHLILALSLTFFGLALLGCQPDTRLDTAANGDISIHALQECDFEFKNRDAINKLVESLWSTPEILERELQEFENMNEPVQKSYIETILGWSDLKRGRHERAKLRLANALEHCKNNHRAWFLLAEYHFDQGKYRLSNDHLSLSLAHDEKAVETFDIAFLRAKNFDQLNEVEGAIVWATIAHRLDPGNQEVLDFLNDLELKSNGSLE